MGCDTALEPGQPVPVTENREIFMHHGGEQFSYVPCLNDSDASIRMITELVERELAGWV